MGILYSKLLCEYTVVANSNDRLKVDDSPSSGPYVITLTAGRYRDMIALAAELQTQLNASGATATFTVTVSNTTGLITISASGAWSVDWNTGTYGTTLRNDLGFSSSTTVGNAITGASQPTGSFYPTEPVESDDRPATDGADRWQSDTMQQEGRSGTIATKGGATRYYRRSFTFLLPQDDLAAFSAWLYRCSQGYSFAYYHDRTYAWDGPDDEYRQYKLVAEGEAGIAYEPERVEPTTNLWHRATVVARQYVAPST